MDNKFDFGIFVRENSKQGRFLINELKCSCTRLLVDTFSIHYLLKKRSYYQTSENKDILKEIEEALKIKFNV